MIVIPLCWRKELQFQDGTAYFDWTFGDDWHPSFGSISQSALYLLSFLELVNEKCAFARRDSNCARLSVHSKVLARLRQEVSAHFHRYGTSAELHSSILMISTD